VFRDVVGECVREFSLRKVLARDVVAAQADGLLTLTGLETPLEMAGCALERPTGGGWMEAVVDARAIAGMVVAVEGIEYTEESAAASETAADRLAHGLELGLRATGLSAVVNLNVARPPSWAGDLAEGPLFVEQRRPVASHRLAALSDSLLPALLPIKSGINEAMPAYTKSKQEVGTDEDHSPYSPSSTSSIRVDWHLSERDFLDDARDRLIQVARQAAHAPLAFVFDRPRRPVALAEGMDRKHPAVLLSVGLHLTRLLDQPGVRNDSTLFLQKVGSLARMALSAGIQKRDFLRRTAAGRPALTRGFLLDRARLVVAPIGLENVVSALTGASLCEASGLVLGRQIVERLHQVLHADGLARRLHVLLDSPLGGFHSVTEPAGLSACNATATVKNQLKAAGALHAIAGSGTAWALTPGETPPTPEQIGDGLRWAWQQTDIVRLRWAFASPAARQLTLPMEEGG
jgi:hypothetical protein